MLTKPTNSAEAPETIPVTAIVTAYGRIPRLLETLRRILDCRPRPAEVLVHVDGGDVACANAVKEAFPQIHCLFSDKRSGPGGGRNRLIEAATYECVAAFDDDSEPLDEYYFAEALALQGHHPDVPVIAAKVFDQVTPPRPASSAERWSPDFVGCGAVYRKSSFLKTGGYVPLPHAYGMEEVDLSLRLFAAGHRILESDSLRVFHHVDFSGHERKEVNAATLANLPLLTFLRYPLWLWPLGAAQFLSRIIWLVGQNRTHGIGLGIRSVPGLLWSKREYRKCLPGSAILAHVWTRQLFHSQLQDLETTKAEAGRKARDLRATLVITTKDRRDELRDALKSAFDQSIEMEVLVIDDGSTDGTAAMVASDFPKAVVYRCEISSGYIEARNLGARLAAGDIIFSIDDDAVFSSPNIVAQTISDFCDDRIGAVAIPFIDVNKRPDVRQKAPDEDGIWITDSYIGTAHAVRRELFLRLGGYYPNLVHQGEEEDFCIRMLDAGHVVRLGRSAPIHHFESPKRDFSRMDYYGVRNLILFAWRNTPAVALLPHLFFTTLRALSWTLRLRRLRTRFTGLLAGYLLLLKTPRHPVATDSYLRFRSLKWGNKELLSPLTCAHE
jgi:GT2 family glycosyltransferase